MSFRPRPITLVEHLRRQRLAASPIKHRGTGTPEHNIWILMRQRCDNPKRPDYPCYGGRGIIYAERWKSFENFLADMGPRPPGGTLERLDNSKGYEPGNCAWRSRREQALNTRRTIKITRDGITLCLKEWCARLGQPYQRTRDRIALGWPAEKALSAPRGSRNVEAAP